MKATIECAVTEASELLAKDATNTALLPLAMKDGKILAVFDAFKEQLRSLPPDLTLRVLFDTSKREPLEGGGDAIQVRFSVLDGEEVKAAWTVPIL